MILSTKLTQITKLLRLETTNYICIRTPINLENSSSQQLYLHTLIDKYNRSRISSARSNCCNSARIVTPACFLKYTTKAEEIPPLPPSPAPESDVFGSIGNSKHEAVELDSDEQKAEERLKTLGGRVPRKLKSSLGEYAKMMKTYIMKGDLESAENIIFQCRKNRDRPSLYMYTLLIRAFSLQGDIKSTWKYFSQLRSLNYPVKANTYTSLFNACANSPITEKALIKLDKIRKHMEENNIKKDYAHYNVLVRAYGRHAKYEEALKLFQEMIDKKMKITMSTLNSLMFAANSNTVSGLKSILHVWQLMRKMNLPPDLFTYNLLLRGIRDTHFGGCTINQMQLIDTEYPIIISEDNRPDLLLYPPKLSSLPFNNILNEEVLLIDAPKAEPESTESIIPSNSSDSTSLSTPNSIRTVLPPEIANMNLDAVLKQNKLILFGGFEEIIKKMKIDKVKPNIKTVTYLMELVPNSVAAEDQVIKYAKSENVTLDIDFYNMLIKKRASRGAKIDAKQILNEIHRNDLRPNIVTYGVLAMVCDTYKESKDLLMAMKSTHHTVNKYVATTLLETAFIRRDFKFILEMMEILKNERVRLDELTYEKFDKFQHKMTALVKMKNPVTKKESFKVGFAKFNLRYKTWQTDMNRKIMTERESKDKLKNNK